MRCHVMPLLSGLASVMLVDVPVMLVQVVLVEVCTKQGGHKLSQSLCEGMPLIFLIFRAKVTIIQTFIDFHRCSRFLVTVIPTQLASKRVLH